jgi:hypothetical protein
MPELTAPYWIAKDTLPGLDFNRHLVRPGESEHFPDGAMGVYVDDDFWAVAALPLDRYGDMPIEEIVAEIWPTYAKQATYTPDHGTIEQRLHFAVNEAEAQRKRAEHSEKEVSRLRAERDRNTVGRTELRARNMTRVEAVNGYFVSQYEHLLIATAHEAVPMDDPAKRGICSICSLYVSDRVHQEEWIAKKRAGHAPDMPWHRGFGDERHPEAE